MVVAARVVAEAVRAAGAVVRVKVEEVMVQVVVVVASRKPARRRHRHLGTIRSAEQGPRPTPQHPSKPDQSTGRKSTAPHSSGRRSTSPGAASSATEVAGASCTRCKRAVQAGG